MAKRSLSICAFAALVLVGCGTTPYSSINKKIVSNNSAAFQADAKKATALYYGELDAEMLMRTKAPARTPDRPTAPQPIRPKPQGDSAAADEATFADDRSDVDAQTGHSSSWMSQLENAITGRTDLADQAAFLKQTPAFQLDEVHRLFDDEYDALSAAAAKVRQDAWRKATPASRLAQFKAKQREVADQWNQPVSGFDPLP